jgi:Relaxase/Mobilisation nuclease domain
MSITKVGKAKSSSDAVEYVLKEEKNGEKQPEIIGGNVAGSKLQEIKDEFREQEKLNFKVKNTVTHISISFPTDRNISNQIATDYADELAEKLGFEMNPYVVVRHFDKDNRSEDSYSHIHIVASRINNDGTLISEWQIAERTIAATVELDRKFELQSVEYQKVNQGEKTERNIKKNEYRVMQKTGKLSVLEEFKDVAEDALRRINEAENKTDSAKSNLNKTRFFIEKLQESGFEVLPFIAKADGQMKGFSFKKDKLIFTASKAGKKFGWTNLATQLEYNSEKDLRFLINLKDEVLAESDKKTLPTDGNPNPNPSENESKEKAENTENSVETISLKINREEFSEPQEIQNQAEKKVEKTLDANELFEVEENKQTRNSAEKVEKENHLPELNNNENRNESQEKQNEKTAEFTSDKPRIEPDKSINGNVEKEESNSEKQVPKLAETARNESDSSLEKVEIVGEKSAEIRSDRADHSTNESRKEIGGNNPPNLATARNDNEETTTFDSKYKQRPNRKEERNERFEVESGSVGFKGTDRCQNNGSNGTRVIENEREVSSISELGRKHQNKSIEGVEKQGHFGSRLSDRDQRQAEKRGGDITEADFGNGEKNQIISQTNSGDKGGNGFNPAKPGTTGGKSDKDTECLDSAVNTHNNRDVLQFSDNQRLDRRIEGNEIGFAKKGGNIRSSDNGNRNNATEYVNDSGKSERNLSGGGQILQTDSTGTAETVGRSAEKSRRTAEITTQIINVKFFSGGLNKKIVEKWKEVIENSNPQESLREIAKPQTDKEKADLRKNLDFQVKYFAENLNLPKPEITKETDTKKLATVLTKIEVNNFAEVTKIKVNDRTIERLAKEKETFAKMSPTDEQISQSKENAVEIPFRQIFSTGLEVTAFNSLLKPESVKFDKKHILETRENVRVDEVAANETVRLVQIAYGGQCDKFTNEFKSDLADRIYNQPSTVTEIYNNYRDFDWQKTIQNFAPIVNNLADQHGITIQTPTDGAEKNKLLTQNLAQQIIKTYEEQNNPVEKYIQVALSKNVETTANKQITPAQTERIINSTDSKLEPVEFKNSLEASFNNFDKRDDKKKSESSKSLVEKVREVEEKKIEKRQLEIREEMFLGGRSM